MNVAASALANGAILSALLLVPVWLALRLVPPRALNATTRYLIWWIALAVTITLPAFYARAPQHVVELRAGRAGQRSAAGALPVHSSHVAPAAGPAFSAIPLQFPVQIEGGEWLRRVTFVWMLTSALLLVRLLLSYATLYRRSARACALGQGVQTRLVISRTGRRGVRLAGSADIAIPMAAGPVRPAILIPTWLIDELSEDDLDHIVLHEAAHLARRDDYALLLERALEALFWLHPVVRWIARQIDLEREIAADDRVIEATGRPREYAESLTRTVALCGRVRPSLAAAPMGFHRPHLSRRVELLMDPTRSAGTRLLGARLCACTAALAVLACTLGRPPGLVAFAAPVSAPMEFAVSAPLPAEAPGLNFDLVKERVMRDLKNPGRILMDSPHPVRRSKLLLVAAAAAVAAAAQPADTRHLALYFYAPGMAMADQTRALAAAQKFVETRMQPTDQVAIMVFDGSAVKVRQDFTGDGKLLADTLQKLDLSSGNTSSGSDSQLPALKSVVQILGLVSGKKSLLYFTSGPIGAGDNQSQLQEAIQAAGPAKVALYVIDVRGIVPQ